MSVLQIHRNNKAVGDLMCESEPLTLAPIEHLLVACARQPDGLLLPTEKGASKYGYPLIDRVKELNGFCRELEKDGILKVKILEDDHHVEHYQWTFLTPHEIAAKRMAEINETKN